MLQLPYCQSHGQKLHVKSSLPTLQWQTPQPSPHRQKKSTRISKLTEIDLPMCEPMDQQDKNNDNPNQVYNSGFPSRTRNQLQVILVTLFGNVDKRHNFYAILDNGSTISYVLNTATDKVRAPKTSEFDLNISHAFDESVMPENFVRLDVGKFNSDQSLFRLNYVHEVSSNYSKIGAPRNTKRLRKQHYKRFNTQQFLHG